MLAKRETTVILMSSEQIGFVILIYCRMDQTAAWLYRALRPAGLLLRLDVPAAFSRSAGRARMPVLPPDSPARPWRSTGALPRLNRLARVGNSICMLPWRYLAAALTGAWHEVTIAMLC
jgi:hypothetical protein